MKKFSQRISLYIMILAIALALPTFGIFLLRYTPTQAVADNMINEQSGEAAVPKETEVQEGPRMGKVYQINRSSGEIIMQSSVQAHEIRMGMRLYTRIDGKAAVMKATFPMQSVVKCRIEGRHRKYLGSIRVGMPMYKYVNGVEDERKAPAQRHRAGAAKTVGGIELVYIPGGPFMMGAPDGEGNDNENPRHKVTVSGFWMGKYEVTQGQYEVVMGNNPSYFKGDTRRPVGQVTWHDAQLFCKKFSTKHGVRARLPYEVEWEYACRAGSTTQYYWGDSMDGNYCWCGNNSENITHSVGGKRPNAFGLYDMSGNVWEWCTDWYDENHYRNNPAVNLRGPSSGQYRVIRGGSWYDDEYSIRSAYRGIGNPGGRSSCGGFRVVVPAVAE